MNITEIQANGLSIDYAVVITNEEIDQQIDNKLRSELGNITLPGFRKGKAPFPLIRKRFAESVRQDVLRDCINNFRAEIETQQDLRLARDFEMEGANYEPGKDLHFTAKADFRLSVSDFKLGEVSLEHLKIDLSDHDIETRLQEIAERTPVSTPSTTGGAADGDEVVIDFEGFLDGKAFEGGKGDNMRVVIGEKKMLPDFEKGLVGVTANSETSFPVVFPADYGQPTLAGKTAEFKIKVKEVNNLTKRSVDDELATHLGLSNLAELREKVTESLKQEVAPMEREVLKRELFDRLAELHDFAVAPRLVDGEFAQFWPKIEHAYEHKHLDPEDAGKDLETLRTEYRAIAERRVRLGFLLEDIYRDERLSIRDEEVTSEIYRLFYQGSPQEQQGLAEAMKQNPQAVRQSVRMSLIEDRTVDVILEKANVSEKLIGLAEFRSEHWQKIVDEQAHDHHDHDHDHHHDHDHGHHHHDHGHDHDHVHDHHHHDHDHHDHDHAESEAKPPKKAAKVKKAKASS